MRAWQAAACGLGQLHAVRGQERGELARTRVACVQAQQVRGDRSRGLVVAQLQQHLRQALGHRRVQRAAAQAVLEQRARQAPLPQLRRLRRVVPGQP